MRQQVLTEEQKRWRIVYPAYLNKKLKISQGRRIPIEKAVDNPSPGEIVEICKFLNFPYLFEVSLSLFLFRCALCCVLCVVCCVLCAVCCV